MDATWRFFVGQMSTRVCCGRLGRRFAGIATILRSIIITRSFSAIAPGTDFRALALRAKQSGNGKRELKPEVLCKEFRLGRFNEEVHFDGSYFGLVLPCVLHSRERSREFQVDRSICLETLAERDGPDEWR